MEISNDGKIQITLCDDSEVVITGKDGKSIKVKGTKDTLLITSKDELQRTQFRGIILK